MLWIQRSFKRQIIFILFVSVSLFGFGAIVKNYIDEKKQLNLVLESQVAQLNHRFALSLSSNVFYKDFYEISDDIFNLYEYNHKTAKKSGSLFSIKDIAVVNTNQKIIGHSDPKRHAINSSYVASAKKTLTGTKDKYSLVWNSDYTNLYIRTPIYASQALIAYIYMNIDPIYLKQKEKMIFKNLIIFGLIFALVLVFISTILARLIDKPMQEILGSLDDLGSGGLYLPLAMKRKDEFYTLSTALRSADKRIAQQKNELLDIQLGLEEMVDERTKELTKLLDEMQKFQKQLVETEKMSALGSLVAGVAHEINTPLGVSLTGITFIESETKTIVQAMQNQTLGKNALSEYLNTVAGMSESMHLSLLNAANLVRSFKQVAIDQHTEDKRHFNLHQYFDEVLISLNNKLKYEQVIIKNEIQKSIELYSYAGIFSQIFTNFIINSLNHAFDEQSQNEEIVVKAWEDSENLYLTYEDNGKGIEDANLSKIFDPFFTTALGKGGSGLGLNIIYNLIVHKLKGDITCKNKEEGIRMTITIPMQELEDE